MTLSSIGLGTSPATGNEVSEIEPTHTSGDVPVHTNEYEEKSLRASSDGGDHELPVFPQIFIKMKWLTNNRLSDVLS